MLVELSRHLANDNLRAYREVPLPFRPYVERVETIERRISVKTSEQLSVFDEMAAFLWPQGFAGKDGRKLPDPLRRFVKNAQPDTVTGCWNWRGAMNTNGYACHPVSGKRRLAHRWIYDLAYGPIPEDLVVDHICFNKGCVYLPHLQAITQSENVRRSLGRPTEIPHFLPLRGGGP